MTRDRIDALAEQLFAAAREERPDRELGARVERATASGADAAAGSGESTHEGPAGRVRRPLLMRALLAAIVCGGVAALVLLPRTRDAVLISAERAPGVGAKPGTLHGAERVAGEEQARREPPSPREPLPPAAEPNEHRRSPSETPAAPAVETRGHPTGSTPRSTATSTPTGDVPRRAASPDAVQTMPADEHAPAPATSPTLSNELAALKQIRQALRNGDGPAALALLDRHAAGEYGSSLALEASVLRVEALDAVGRRAEAEALARRFVRDNPDSPLAERAQRFIDRTEPARPANDARP
jgi:hypothetical protein